MTRVGFSAGPVSLEQTGDVTWSLTRPLVYRSLAGQTYRVPVGAPTDGASVPRPVAWLVPRSGRYLPAAVVHDRAYRVRVPGGEMTYREADQVLLEGMRLLGVPWVTRWLIFSGVRLAGLFRRGGRGGWWRDAPAVLLCALLALPLVVPPAVLVAVALGILWTVEAASWLALRVVARRDRQINPPTLSGRV